MPQVAVLSFDSFMHQKTYTFLQSTMSHLKCFVANGTRKKRYPIHEPDQITMINILIRSPFDSVLY